MQRRLNFRYSGVVRLVPKLLFAYRFWAWIEILTQFLGIIILVAFWTAVYQETDRINTLTFQDVLNYAILSQIFLIVIRSDLVVTVSSYILDGSIIMHFVQPLDFQLWHYVHRITEVTINLVLRLSVLLIPCVLLGLSLQITFLKLLAFCLMLFLGFTVIFLFDWLFVSLTFYTDEGWGLNILRFNIMAFLSGALLPLPLFPEVIREIFGYLPFAQAIHFPISLLCGLVPLTEVPDMVLRQCIWIVILFLSSRYVFRIAVKRVAILGG